jgi:hypothetical protein
MAFKKYNFNMNQDRNIGTVRLSAGFCDFFLPYLKNNYGNISNIFSNPLNFPTRKLFYVTNIREAFGPLAYNFELATFCLCKLPFILATFG